MIPIPDPSRLVPPRMPPSSSGGGRHSLPVGLLTLGSLPVLLAGTVGAGMLGAALSPWLAIPAGLIGFGIAMGLTQESIVVCGVVEAIFYAAITFLFSDGMVADQRDSSLILAGTVAAIILGLTYTARRER